MMGDRTGNDMVLLLLTLIRVEVKVKAEVERFISSALALISPVHFITPFFSKLRGKADINA